MVRNQKKYDINLLKEVIQRGKIIIDFEKIKKINCNVYLDFICKCGNAGNKIFNSMVNNGSMCRKCTIKLFNIRHKASLLKTRAMNILYNLKKQKKKNVKHV